MTRKAANTEHRNAETEKNGNTKHRKTEQGTRNKKEQGTRMDPENKEARKQGGHAGERTYHAVHAVARPQPLVLVELLERRIVRAAREEVPRAAAACRVLIEIDVHQYRIRGLEVIKENGGRKQGRGRQNGGRGMGCKRRS
ncbi:hypothetical protein FIBSPDRAFT_931953 [Athelia psychrophila]|uniref:Uncharacterized protein n=1 Tax=Athelia psychrophila TaxID=1759441 RepID=A0A166JJQ9_9AGAM|nr:hypothetical protein FIBSPDRAFT_931953 [Fibularhizoctonia sp. CBS 109695]